MEKDKINNSNKDKDVKEGWGAQSGSFFIFGPKAVFKALGRFILGIVTLGILPTIMWNKYDKPKD